MSALSVNNYEYSNNETSSSTQSSVSCTVTPPGGASMVMFYNSELILDDSSRSSSSSDKIPGIYQRLRNNNLCHTNNIQHESKQSSRDVVPKMSGKEGGMFIRSIRAANTPANTNTLGKSSNIMNKRNNTKK